MLGAALVAAPCYAQRTDDDLARAHFDSASAYYEQGRYDEAAREFMESFELSHRPALLDNAARAYERGLRFDEAIRTLERLRELEPERAAAITDRIEAIRVLQSRVGSSGAAPPPEPAPAPSGGGGYVSIPGVVLLATGGALGIAALITGIVGHGIYEDLAASCSPDRVCDPSRQGDIDTGTGLVVSSTVLTFAAPIAAGIGIVLLVVDTGGGSSERAVRLVPGPGEAGLGVEARF